MIVDLLAAVLLVAGLFFVVVGITGVLRLPDFYARLHATSKCDTLGLALMVAGVALLTGLVLKTVKIVMLVAIVALVNSTAAHALGRAAYRSGLEPWTRGDEPPQ
ncbi:monovalent cation/H(+) antiporter subunit G [soil metagenome]|nr:monovalent cation/H(+) antiporter subunit G [Acidobacteriota bacterium]